MNAALQVWPSLEPCGRGDSSLGVNMGSDSIPYGFWLHSLFQLRLQTEVQSVHACIPSPLCGLIKSWHSCPWQVNASNKIHPASTDYEDRMWQPLVWLKNSDLPTNLAKYSETNRYSWECRSRSEVAISYTYTHTKEKNKQKENQYNDNQNSTWPTKKKKTKQNNTERSFQSPTNKKICS